jgi:hypothetical protein
MLGQPAGPGRLAGPCQEARRLIRIFDAKPLVKPCLGTGCGRLATRGCVYRGGTSLTWWCDDCDPYQHGAERDKLLVIVSFGDAIDYVSWYCGDTRSSMRAVVKELAKAKGLPDRVGEREALAIFR